jgi:hypothetical protein
MSVPRAGSRSQRFFTFLSPSLPRASSGGMGRRRDFEKGNSYTLKVTSKQAPRNLLIEYLALRVDHGLSLV